MPRVLVVGSINMDLIVRCQRVPREGETVPGEDFRTAPGGKGANQAVACSRLGAHTTMVGRVGEDEFGRQLRQSLEANGVGVEWVRADPNAPTGVALILLEQAGENRIVVVGGANRRLGEEDIAATQQLLPTADIVVMPLELPIPVVVAVAQAARRTGVTTVLDAGPATPEAVEAGLPGMVDVISPNETEAEALTGAPVDTVEDARRAAATLRGMGSKHVVIKLGEMGAYLAGPEGEGHFPAFPVQAVDTTAAGDAFTACLAVGLASGISMRSSLRRANAAGALACLKLGAQPSMPTLGAVEEFLKEHAAG